jgi:hypothetical protein
LVFYSDLDHNWIKSILVQIQSDYNQMLRSTKNRLYLTKKKKTVKLHLNIAKSHT